VLPVPSVPELYPHLRNGEDAPWHGAKADIGRALAELTALPRMNPARRRAAHAAGIARWDDPRLEPGALGITGDGAVQFAAVLAANTSPVPVVLPPSLPPGGAWREHAPLELYVDFETVSNIADDFTSLPAVGGWAGIFQVGCGWVAPASGEWRFAQWTADRLDSPSELRILDAWTSLVSAAASDAGVPLEAVRAYCWSAAEGSALDSAYNAARARHPEAAWPDIPWFDLLPLARHAPLGVTGAFGFGLKAIAKAMAAQGLISTTWGDGPTDGLGAMVGAWWCDREAARLGVPMASLALMADVARYN
jgi:hypothetical protein